MSCVCREPTPGHADSCDSSHSHLAETLDWLIEAEAENLRDRLRRGRP